eukprot:2430728-Rhodomonas_salina.1
MWEQGVEDEGASPGGIAGVRAATGPPTSVIAQASWVAQAILLRRVDCPSPSPSYLHVAHSFVLQISVVSRNTLSWNREVVCCSACEGRVSVVYQKKNCQEQKTSRLKIVEKVRGRLSE